MQSRNLYAIGFNSLLPSSKNWLASNLTLCLNWFVFRPSTGSNDRLHHSYKAMKKLSYSRKEIKACNNQQNSTYDPNSYLSLPCLNG
jgi:hypothetical protein